MGNASVDAASSPYAGGADPGMCVLSLLGSSNVIRLPDGPSPDIVFRLSRFDAAIISSKGEALVIVGNFNFDLFRCEALRSIVGAVVIICGAAKRKMSAIGSLLKPDSNTRCCIAVVQYLGEVDG
jgi:hypothetical protein